jgi:antitoxin (DNA-binding transcriptional repressor) of toxin-antitoxin stability system
MNGEEVVIAKAGKPVARILPFAAKNISPRKPGIDKGILCRWIVMNILEANHLQLGRR